MTKPTINDRRRELGLPPLKGGDIPLEEWFQEKARRVEREGTQIPVGGMPTIKIEKS
ncbi:MAG: hypothetical protein RIF41_05510 [Polyangiaceae bacterium]